MDTSPDPPSTPQQQPPHPQPPATPANFKHNAAAPSPTATGGAVPTAAMLAATPAAAATAAAAAAGASSSSSISVNSNSVLNFDVDGIIAKLLEVRGKRPGKQVNLLESEIRSLCIKSKEIFQSQSALLELEAPIKIVGDIHGQYYDLLRLFEYGGFPPDANYLFLGDYVDRGKQSLETICLLLAYKCKYPEKLLFIKRKS